MNTFYNEYFIKLSQIKRSTSSHFVTFPSTLKEVLMGRRPGDEEFQVFVFSCPAVRGRLPTGDRSGLQAGRCRSFPLPQLECEVNVVKADPNSNHLRILIQDQKHHMAK